MQAKKYAVFFHKTSKKTSNIHTGTLFRGRFSRVVNTWPQPFEAEKDSVLLGFQFDWGWGVGFGSNNRKVRDIVKFYYAFTSRPTNVASTFLNSFCKTSPGRQERSPRNCLIPRRLYLDENVRAKEDGKEITGVPFPWSLAVLQGRDWSPVKSTSAWVGSLARLHVLGQQFLKFLLCLLQPAIHSSHHSWVSPTPSKS